MRPWGYCGVCWGWGGTGPSVVESKKWVKEAKKWLNEQERVEAPQVAAKR